MIATLIEPFAAISGSISKRDKLYVRVLNGRVLLQHKPRRQSSLQAFLRKKFGCDYGTARKKGFFVTFREGVIVQRGTFCWQVVGYWLYHT